MAPAPLSELAPPLELDLLAEIPDCEGPTLARDGTRHVVSISEGRSYALGAGDGGEPVVTVLHGGPNGLTEGADGTLYAAQMGSRLIAPPDPPTTGGVQAFIPGGEPPRFLTTDPISPNDLCFGPDGMLYVTDPTRQRPWVDGRLWRVDPTTGHAQLLRTVGWDPNGIGFGPEDDRLYVAAMSEACIVRFAVGPGGLGEPELFARMPAGVPDGFAFTADGRLVVGAIHFETDDPGELQVYEPDGTLVQRLAPGRHSRYTNLAIDGDGTALVTCTDGGEVLELRGFCGPGLPLHPFRG